MLKYLSSCGEPGSPKGVEVKCGPGTIHQRFDAVANAENHKREP